MASEPDILIRGARADDGARMWRVVRDAGTLDLNSSYLYLLLARDFAETCVVAEQAGRVTGFVTGYLRPTRPDALFLWQIGILPEMQGLGLGKRLVTAFLQQPAAAGTTRLETTVTPSNTASRALFSAIARALDADCTIHPCFAEEDFPDAGHEAEELFDIGPFDRHRVAAL